MSSDDVLASARAALLAEVGWRGRSEGWSTAVLVPLTATGELSFALPYAHGTTAEALDDADTVVVVCSDARLTPRGWEAVAVAGRARVEPDLDGERFRSGLLDEELRKHPPARLLADSLLQQRENWWYLPRLLVRLARIEAVWRVAPRSDPALTGVLFGAGPRPAATVEVGPAEGERLDLRALDGGPLPEPGPAMVLRHDWSVPDLEQRCRLEQRGHLDGSTLTVTAADGSLALPGPAGLLTRYRRGRAFERACRRALADEIVPEGVSAAEPQRGRRRRRRETPR